MSRSGRALSHHAHGFPRVSGDEPHVAVYLGGGLLFSPRERG